MDPVLASLFNFYTFSTGRRLFALFQVRKAAVAASLVDIAKHVDAAITHDMETRALEAKWVARKPTTYSPEAKQIDIYVDAAITAFRDGTDAQIRASAEGDPLAEAAQKMLAVLLPKGAGAVTSLPFVEELAEVQRILSRVDEPDYKALVTELGLTRQVARLKDLEAKYRAAIEGPGQLTFAQVKDARTKGQSLMLQAVAMILGKYPSDSEADRKARGALLSPILVQNEAIRRYLRDRKPIEDVNPETGEIEQTPPVEGESQTP
ncbi:hypothetical protein KEG38_40240 [Polyangium jinanense]|uniref:DUF6261 family protein n=1 Tax=Polyangium jinanense TaxID=2829994 RepID=UPI00234070E7|nr:DUF6261 family protein [Polyangium jinanense]MDC3960155.1 hypothetical protein [Polyangium jinanense]